MDRIVNKGVHTGFALTTTAVAMAAAADRRVHFRVTVTSGVAEVFLGSQAGVADTGTRVTAVCPLEFNFPYYNAIWARAVSGTVNTQLMECFD